MPAIMICMDDTVFRRKQYNEVIFNEGAIVTHASDLYNVKHTALSSACCSSNLQLLKDKL